MRVLIVEDEVKLAHLIRKALYEERMLAGAYDYMGKPFAFGDLSLDTATHSVKRGDVEIALSTPPAWSAAA